MYAPLYTHTHELAGICIGGNKCSLVGNTCMNLHARIPANIMCVRVMKCTYFHPCKYTIFVFTRVNTQLEYLCSSLHGVNPLTVHFFGFFLVYTCV